MGQKEAATAVPRLGVRNEHLWKNRFCDWYAGAFKQIQADFSGKSNKKTEDEKKKEIFRIAGQVIAEEIICMDYDSEAHIADLEDLDTETQLAYLPPCLRLLFKSLQSKRSRSDASLKKSMIRQAIVKM